MKAATLFIPSPADLATVIQGIEYGQTKTMLEIRKELAVRGNAETSCPAKTVVYWKWLAAATEELAGQPSNDSISWWRVLKDGKPSRRSAAWRGKWRCCKPKAQCEFRLNGSRL